MALTARQQRFVAEYLIDLNATQAAIRAGYSKRTAGSIGEENLKKPEIAAAVAEAQAARAERTAVKQDDVLRELARIALCDISAAFDDAGNLKPLKDIPADVRRAIAGVETRLEGNDEEGFATVTKVKFWDKPKSLELIGRHLKMFTDKVEISGKLTLAQLVQAATEPKLPPLAEPASAPVQTPALESTAADDGED